MTESSLRASVEKRRKRLHVLTADGRFEMVRFIEAVEAEDGRVAHGAVVDHFEDEMEATSVGYHLQMLLGVGIIGYEVLPSERARDDPYVYYWLTEPGLDLYNYVRGWD